MYDIEGKLSITYVPLTQPVDGPDYGRSAASTFTSSVHLNQCTGLHGQNTPAGSLDISSPPIIVLIVRPTKEKDEKNRQARKLYMRVSVCLEA